MIYLIIVSIIWAFSFGLIKGVLTGLDSNLVSFIRMLLSLFIFIPFLELKGIKASLKMRLFFIGMVQYGIMYITYIYSFKYLKAHQVALFTIFTPLFVTLINDVISKKFSFYFLLSVILAIVGTYYINPKEAGDINYVHGFLILQISNVCFAFGQVLYKKVMSSNKEVKDLHVFGLLYFGGVVITGLTTGFYTDFSNLRLELKQVLALLYLGIVASGICFFLWNYGAKKVNAGALGIMNNLKIPLGVACSMFVFHEQADLKRLLIGGGLLIAALILNEVFDKKFYANKKEEEKPEPAEQV